MSMLRRVAVFALVCSLVGCADDTVIGSKDPNAGVPEQELFQRGEKAMKQGQFEKAAQNFESLDAQYPFGRYAEPAMRDLIFSHYKAGDASSAAATAKRYLQLFPRSRDADYAAYMRGVAEFEQDRGLLARFLPFDQSERDPGSMMDAYNDFAQFLQHFPKSQYAHDAEKRMIYLRNLFAKKELAAAEFYFQRKGYAAAANRAGYLIRTFPQSPEVARALVISYHSNLAMGLKREADDTLKVLKLNYPGVVI